LRVVCVAGHVVVYCIRRCPFPRPPPCPSPLLSLPRPLVSSRARMRAFTHIQTWRRVCRARKRLEVSYKKNVTEARGDLQYPTPCLNMCECRARKRLEVSYKKTQQDKLRIKMSGDVAPELRKDKNLANVIINEVTPKPEAPSSPLRDWNAAPKCLVAAAHDPCSALCSRSLCECPLALSVRICSDGTAKQRATSSKRCRINSRTHSSMSAPCECPLEPIGTPS
jgi:hypothetical protein